MEAQRICRLYRSKQLFVYCLSSFEKGGLRTLGQNLLMLLVGGPFGLRNFCLLLAWMGPLKHSPVCC